MKTLIKMLLLLPIRRIIIKLYNDKKSLMVNKLNDNEDDITIRRKKNNSKDNNAGVLL